MTGGTSLSLETEGREKKETTESRSGGRRPAFARRTWKRRFFSAATSVLIAEYRGRRGCADAEPIKTAARRRFSPSASRESSRGPL